MKKLSNNYAIYILSVVIISILIGSTFTLYIDDTYAKSKVKQYKGYEYKIKKNKAYILSYKGKKTKLKVPAKIEKKPVVSFTIGTYKYKKIKSVNVRMCKKLVKLDLCDTRINKLDLRKNKQLKALYLQGCNNLKSLNVKKNKNLQTLYCDNTKLKRLDLTKNINLRRLSLYQVKLSPVDLTKNTKIWELELSGMRLTDIDLSKNVNLTTLNIGRNNLSALDLSNNKKLGELEASYSNINSINLPNTTYLEDVDLTGNNLTSIDLTKNINLGSLCIAFNKGLSVDISQCPRIYYLEYSPSLTKVIVSGATLKNQSIYTNL